nr:PREDICTED: monocarboxylate transporter 12-like [Latimeria chalumnae]|eukprot:XP_006010562.1 PREDICTED: monocarboxylate transporter 12-like [Latimeria chalumnae]
MARSKKLLYATPPDGGWGWMIVAGCFLVTVCTRAVTRFLKKYRTFCYLLAVGLDGLSCLTVPVLQSFALLIPFSVMYGYFDGAYVTLIPVVTADIVGTTYLSSALGVVYFLHAVPYLVSPPIAGWLVDRTGNYTATFLLCGFSMIFSSLLLFCAILAKKWKSTQSGDTKVAPKPQIWSNSTTCSLAKEQV